MCMQCAAGAMTVGAGATGLRAYLVHLGAAWLTPRRQTLITRALIASSVLAAGLIGPAAA